eukprot:COSAG01_NODE_2264_length_8047_cov_18.774409_3_plen_572_part_00
MSGGDHLSRTRGLASAAASPLMSVAVKTTHSRSRTPPRQKPAQARTLAGHGLPSNDSAGHSCIYHSEPEPEPEPEPELQQEPEPPGARPMWHTWTRASTLVDLAHTSVQDFDERMLPSELNLVQVPSPHRDRAIDDETAPTLLKVPRRFEPGLPKLVDTATLQKMVAQMAVGMKTDLGPEIKHLLLDLHLLFDRHGLKSSKHNEQHNGSAPTAFAKAVRLRDDARKLAKKGFKAALRHPDIKDLRAKPSDMIWDKIGKNSRSPTSDTKFYRNMGIFVMPVVFNTRDEPVQLLEKCVERCIEETDANIFGREALRGLEKCLWSPHVISVRFVFRTLNALMAVSFHLARLFGSKYYYWGPWVVVAFDFATMVFGGLFLMYTWHHKLLTTTSVKYGLLMWTSMIGGAKASLIAFVHYSCQVQANIILTAFSCYLLCFDTYMAWTEIAWLPRESPPVQNVWALNALATLCGALGMIPAGCTLVFGVEATLSIRQTKLSMAFARSTIDIFGLLPRFVTQLAICLGLSMHVALRNEDPEFFVAAEMKQWDTAGHSMFSAVDYFVGQQPVISCVRDQN